MNIDKYTIIQCEDLELVKEAFEILIEDIENDLVDNSKTSQYRQKLLVKLNELYKAGIIPHIQVHDELDISVKDDKQAKQIVEIMESAVELEVPNKVDYEAGPSWGEIK